MGDPTRPVRPDPRGSNDEGLNVEQYTTLELDASTWDVFADLVVSSIHMVDAGSAVQAALHVPGGVYNFVDDEPLTKYDDATALGRAAGSRCWLRYPGRSGLLLGNRSTSLTRSLRVSNQRFRDLADWTPTYPSARQGWPATARSLVTYTCP